MVARGCRIQDCERPHIAKGLCKFHWERQRKGRVMERPWHGRKDEPGWITPAGYRMLFVDGRAVFAHRLVAARTLGRALLPTEVVHHQDGNKLNNTPENLIVMLRGQHSTLHTYKGGERHPADCPVCGCAFMRLSYRPNSTCSKSCGAVRNWRLRTRVVEESHAR